MTGNYQQELNKGLLYVLLKNELISLACQSSLLKILGCVLTTGYGQIKIRNFCYINCIAEVKVP